MNNNCKCCFENWYWHCHQLIALQFISLKRHIRLWCVHCLFVRLFTIKKRRNMHDNSMLPSNWFQIVNCKMQNAFVILMKYLHKIIWVRRPRECTKGTLCIVIFGCMGKRMFEFSFVLRVCYASAWYRFCDKLHDNSTQPNPFGSSFGFGIFISFYDIHKPEREVYVEKKNTKNEFNSNIVSLCSKLIIVNDKYEMHKCKIAKHVCFHA